MLCAEVYTEFVATRELPISSMAFMRSVQMSACPFHLNQLLDRHCIDLLTKKYVRTVGYPCLEVCCVLGHFSFTFGGELLRVSLWKAESEARSRLACMRSAALIRVKFSCGYKVSNRAFRSLFVLRLVFKNLEIYFCSFSLTPRV